MKLSIQIERGWKLTVLKRLIFVVFFAIGGSQIGLAKEVDLPSGNTLALVSVSPQYEIVKRGPSGQILSVLVFKSYPSLKSRVSRLLKSASRSSSFLEAVALRERENLEGDDPTEKKAALTRLSSMGADALPAMEAVLELSLRRPDRNKIWLGARETLETLGPHLGNALDRTMEGELLGRESHHTPILLKVAGNRSEWGDRMVAWLRDQNYPNSRVAELALKMESKRVWEQIIRDAVLHEDPKIQKGASEVIADRIWWDDDFADRVSKYLKDPNSKIRGRALSVLERLRSRNKLTRHRLMNLVQNGTREEKVQAIRILGEGESAVPYPLISQYQNDKDPEIAAAAKQALTRLVDPREEIYIPSEDPKKEMELKLGLLEKSGFKSEAERKAAAEDLGLIRFDSRSDYKPYVDRVAEILKKEKNPEVTVKLLEYLRRFPEQSTGALPQIVARLKDEDPGVRDRALMSVTETRYYLSPEEEDAYEDLLAQTFKPKSSKKLPNPCKILCQMAEDYSSWRFDETQSTFHDRGSVKAKGLGRAISHLDDLFLLKSMKVCPNVKGKHLARIKDRYLGKRRPKPEQIQCVRKPEVISAAVSSLSKEVESSVAPIVSYDVYGNEYLKLVLDHLIESDHLTEEERKQIIPLRDQANAALFYANENADQFLLGLTGSNLNSYSHGASVLAVDEDAAVEFARQNPEFFPEDFKVSDEPDVTRFVRLSINPEDPRSVLYDIAPALEFPEDREDLYGYGSSHPLGSLGRAPTANLAMYEKNKDPSKEEELRGNLLTSISFFSIQFPELLKHLRNGSRPLHTGPYQNASYYLHISMASALAGVNLVIDKTRKELGALDKEDTVTIAEKKSYLKAVKGLKLTLKRQLLSMVRGDGLFEGPAYMRDIYHNQFGAFSLMAIADECVEEGEPVPLEIRYGPFQFDPT